jgi:hypothetical protein
MRRRPQRDPSSLGSCRVSLPRSATYSVAKRLRHYLDHLERMAAIEDEQAANEGDDDFLGDFPDQVSQSGRASLA